MHIKMLSLLVTLLSFTLIHRSNSQTNNQQPTYDVQSFTQDGHNNPFVYPQMTALCENPTTNQQNLIIFHYGVDGIPGQTGLSFITLDGAYVKSLTNISQSLTGQNPPYQFINDSTVLDYPYSANYMRIIQSTDPSNNQTVELIELQFPALVPIQGGQQELLARMVIDMEGRFVRSFDQLSRPVLPAINPTNNQAINLSVQRNDTSKCIVIGGDDQPIKRTINLFDYWSLTEGRTTFASDPVIMPIPESNNPSNIQYRLVVLLDDSQLSYPYVHQAILIFDPMNGELLTVFHQISFDANQISSTGLFQLTINAAHQINQPARIVVRNPQESFSSATIYMYTINQMVTQPKPSLVAGQVSNVWFTNYGYLQGQAVVMNPTTRRSMTCSSVVSDLYANLYQQPYTREIICFDQSTKQTINRFNQITSLTDAAILAGASANLNDYLVLAMLGQSINQSNNQSTLYLSVSAPTSRTTAITSAGVLIVTTTGQFIDFYGNFQLPQTPFFTTSGELAVPDHVSDNIQLINLSTRSVVRTIACVGCLGGSIDSVNGGYVIATSVMQGQQTTGSLQFMHSDWTINNNIPHLTVGAASNSIDQVPSSNPVIDSQGRIYVLAESNGGQARVTGRLEVYNSSTRAMIASHDFSNAQRRGTSGVSQLALAATLTLDPFDQSIVVTTVDFGQVFRTLSYVPSSSPVLSSSSSSSAPVMSSSSTGLSSSSAAPVPSSSAAPVASSSIVPVISSSSSSAPVVPSSSAPVVPSSSAPVVPSSSAPVVPSSSAPVVPSSSAPVVPSSSAVPIVPSSSIAPAPSSSPVMSSSAVSSSSAAISSSSSPSVIVSSSSRSVSSSSSSTSYISSSSSVALTSTGLSSTVVAPSSTTALSSSSASGTSSIAQRSSSSSSIVSSTATSQSSSTSRVSSSVAPVSSSINQISSSSSGVPLLSSSQSSSAVSSTGSRSSSSLFTSLSSAGSMSSSSVPVINPTLSLSSTGARSSSSTRSPVSSSSSALSTLSSSSSSLSPSSSSNILYIDSSSSSGYVDIPVEDDTSSSGLSSGELAAAIVVPVVVSLIILIAALLYFCRPAGKSQPAKSVPAVAPEIDTTDNDHTVNVVEMEPTVQ